MAVSKDPLTRISPLSQSLNVANSVWANAIAAVSGSQKHDEVSDGYFQQVGRAAGIVSVALRQSNIHLSRTPIGANILNLARSDPGASLALWAFSITPVMGELPNYGPQAIMPFWQAAAKMFTLLTTSSSASVHEQSALRSSVEAKAARDEILEIQNASTKAIADATIRLTEIIGSGTNDLRDTVREFKEQGDEALKEARTEWIALRRTYDLQLKTRAPYNYWRSKRIVHQRAAQSWGRAFSWTVGLGTLVLALIGICFALYASAKFEPPYILPLTCIGVPAFLLLWIARLTNRKYNDHLLRSEDAYERATMVKMLLALTRKSDSESAVSDAERAVMVTALFRPGPGLNAEDSPSVSILDHVLKAQRP